MQVLKIPKTELDLAAYKQRQASDSDYALFINQSTVIYDEADPSRPKMVYIQLDDDSSAVVQALQSIDFDIIKQNRTSGMISHSRSFGFTPRRTLRTDFCHAAKLAEENPHAHHVICSYAENAAKWYERHNPEIFAKHAGLMDEHISGEYRIPESVFTSGVVNKNSAIPYHFDAGNFKEVWSCMLAFKKDCDGGHLSVPEYGIGFEIANNTLFMFDGQGVLHGVTPIKLKSRAGFRYTVVYYSLQQIWNCLPITDELLRIRQKKTERELKRARMMREQRNKPNEAD